MGQAATGVPSYTMDHLSVYQGKQRRHSPDRAGSVDDDCELMFLPVCCNQSSRKVGTKKDVDREDVY